MASLNYQIIIGAKDQASSKLGKVRDSAERVAKQAAQLTAAFAAAGTAVLGFATRQVEVIDGMAKAARAAGVSAEALQELRFAAERSGASARQLDEGLRRMNRRIGLAADGAGPAAATLEKMGIAVRDAGGNVRSTEDVLQEFIVKTGELGSQAEIAAAASALFGDDAGPKLALLLAEGESGIAGLREEARKYGIVSNANAAQAEKTQDAITNLKQVFGALGQTIAVTVAPVLEQLARFLATAIPVAATGAQVAIRRLRELMVRALSDITNKARETVDSILAWVPANTDLARSLGETSDKLRGFSADTGDLATVLETETNDALADLDEKINQISQGSIPTAVQALDDMSDGATSASDDLDGMSESLDSATTSAEGVGAASQSTSSDLDDLCASLDTTARCGRNLAETVGPEGGLTAFIEEMADAMRLEAMPATSALLGEFDRLADGGETLGGELEGVKDATEDLIETQAPLEGWADALTAAFGGIEGSAGDAVRGIAGVIGSINQLNATAARQGGTLTLAQQIQGGAQIGGFAGQALGIQGPSGQAGSAIGGALGYAAGAGLTAGMTGILGAAGGPIGAIIGAVLAGSLFEDSGETNPRIAITNNRLFEELDRGDPEGIAARYLTPFSRRSALGVTFQGQQITEALGGSAAQQILDGIVEFDQAIADIVRESGLGDMDLIKQALLGPTGDSTRVYEEGVSLDEILADRFNIVLTGFDETIQRLVGTVTDAEEGFRRLGAAVILVSELETGPLEQYEEALRQAGLTVVESLDEQGSALITLAENYSGSTAELEQLAAGTQAFNQAVIQTLASIDAAKAAVSDITQGTLEGLEFRRIGEDEGPGAQIKFLLDRARQLRGEISGLDSPEAVQQQVALINQLVNQASGLLQPGQIGQFIDNVTPLLTSAEDLAQKRLETIREAVIDVATETGNAIKDAIKEPAATMESASATMTDAANVIIDASNRFQQGANVFGTKVDQFPSQIDVVVAGSEVNAAG